MSIKPYLLSLASYTPGCDNYIFTLPKLENSVEWINVDFKEYPGNLFRFNHIPFDRLDDKRMMVFTDTGDVIFQKPIPELEAKIYVTPERANFDRTSWFNQLFERNDYHELDGTPIYNMGTWAMPVYKVKEMLNYIFSMSHTFKDEGGCDQPLFNMWLRTQKFEEHPELMVCLFNNFETGDVVKENGIFLNKVGKPYSIVHANGNKKDLLIN